MKNILNKVKLLTVVLLLINFTACNDDDGMMSTTIIDVAQENDLTIFITALEITDLTATLQNSGTLTVFAPKNDAFSQYLTDVNIDLNNMTATDISSLRNILQNHIIESTEIRSNDIISESNGYIETRADGIGGANISMFYSHSNDVINLNGESEIVVPDINASNGVLHIVDEVINIPTVADFIIIDPNFNDLALSISPINEPDFIELLSYPNGISPTPYTVFAPINAAFQALLEGNSEWNFIADIPTDLLISVLEHHVVTEENLNYNDFTNGMSISTIEGDVISIQTSFNDGNTVRITDGSGNTDIDIIMYDLQASNGVIHAIESVLIPDTSN